MEAERLSPSVLRRQHLSGSDARPRPDVEALARDLGGLHATDPATPYLSLFARMPGFTRDRLDEALYEKRSLGRIRCVRNTVYILPLDLLPIAFTATRAWRRATRNAS